MKTSLAAAFLAASLANAQTLNTSTGGGYVTYSSVPGYFLQDLNTTNATSFDYTAVNFGLINRTYPVTTGLKDNLTQWEQFALQVEALNAAAPLNTVYKVLFMGRHGEGYHNAAQTFYGTPGWNCYWAELTGNATANWEDAALTPNGIAQALIAHNFWQHEITVQHIPYIQSYYTSPLTRCLQTANYTFAGLDLPYYYPFVPTVKELLREGISIHTCDHRSNRTYIHDLFPSWNIEPGFNEYDELWNGVTAETNSAQNYRSLTVLDEIFTTDDHTWISITSHSGEIASLLSVLNHRTFPLNTGAVIPVLVKAQFMPPSQATLTSVQPFTTSTWCHNAPPVTSIGTLGQGCVCSATTTPLTTLPTQAPLVSGQTAPLNEFTTSTYVSAEHASTSTSSAKSTTAPTTSLPGWPFWPFPRPTWPWGPHPTHWG